ncbi:MAG: hypothetical protein NVV60_11910 [Luteimonas sp.]|nr:hypothetical protein [Luteimonas sp.]
MRTRNVIPKISLIIVLAIVAYALLFMTMARPVHQDFGTKIDWEWTAISVALPVAFFTALAIGVWRAYSSKDYLWLALQLAFFPLACIYTLLINKGANNSFKPTPLRGAA